MPLEEWRRQFKVTVFGQISVTQALMPALLASRARVINIGSLGGKVSMPGFGSLLVPRQKARYAERGKSYDNLFDCLVGTVIGIYWPTFEGPTRGPL